MVRWLSCKWGGCLLLEEWVLLVVNLSIGGFLCLIYVVFVDVNWMINKKMI